MTYYERFGQTGPTPEGAVAPHEHDAGDISGTFGQIRLRGDLYSINWDGGIPVDLSAGRDAAAAAGFALDVSAGAAQFTNIYADGGELRTLTVRGDITLGTGGAMRTAASGQRVELNSADIDSLNLYSGHADEETPGHLGSAQIASTAVVLISSPALTTAASTAQIVLVPGADPSATFINLTAGTVVPGGDNVTDLGSAAFTFKNLYCYGIYDEAGNLRLDTSALSYGANDSGGVGYKVIRQPN